MKIIKIILILTIIMITSCGYKIINNIDETNFNIIQTTYNGDTKINKKLNSNFKRFFDNEKATRFFKVIANSQSVKKITSKDTSGNDTGFSLEIIVNLEFYENEELLDELNLNKKIDYSNLNSQFELKQYEKTITDDLVNLIIVDINSYLISLK